MNYIYTPTEPVQVAPMYKNVTILSVGQWRHLRKPSVLDHPFIQMLVLGTVLLSAWAVIACLPTL